MRKNHTLLISAMLAVSLISCSSPKSYEAITVGEEEDLIKKGDMTTHISLSELQGKAHLYGIGSVTNLKGFIVINDGKPFTSFVQGNSVTIDSTWNTEATLMVYAQAEHWNEINIPPDVKDWAGLESFVMESAKENQINPDAAFPFLLKGNAASVQWRVTDWDVNDKKVTNKKVKASGLKGTGSDVSTTIVGFFCTKPYRVLAERNKQMHLHFCSEDRSLSGHVDDITLSGNMKLYLPQEQ